MPRASNQGGKQPGTGRKPGGTFPTSQRTLVRRDAAGLLKDGEQLPLALIKSVISFSARGLSNSQVAKKLGKDRRTIARILEDYPELVDEAVRAFVDPTSLLAPMLPKASRAYHWALEKGDTSVAKDVFDRAYGKPIVRTQQELQADIRIVFADASEDAG